MNAPRKTTRSQPHRDDGPPDDGPGWLAGIVVALLTARFLLPTEAAVDGETLWLVQLWILAAAVWGWRQFLRGRPWIHWDLGTLAVALLVAGHLVSGFVLFSRGGDKRAAVNLMWEWVSLGITFVIVRSVFAEAGGRRTVIWALACVGVSLAGLGLHQHFVQFPRLAEDYREKRAELDRLHESGARRFARQARVQELTRWFVEREIPLHGPARKQWEARVLSSSEPFGTFGLANTLAGLLVVFLFPAMALTRAGLQERLSRSVLSCWAPAAVALILLACLILTKSRTAWIGGIAGSAVWWWMGRTGSHSGRRWMRWALAGVFAVGTVAAVAAVTGGLDRKVLSESPKSLRYRWQYWTGTAAMLQELPLFGPGPGNFRQRYLKHKLPESSEEIRDPHNLFLDAWSNGGLISLAGLLLLLGWSARSVIRRGGTSIPSDVGSESGAGSPSGIAGIVAGFLLVILYVWFLDTGDLARLWGLMAGSAAAWFLTTQLSTACLAGVGAALAVHLFGAGGIEMPAIAQTLLLLCAAVLPSAVPLTDDAPDDPAVNRGRLVVAILDTATAAVVFGTCLSTATIPVLTRQSAAGKARNLWQAEGNLPQAEQMLKAAAANDPLSPHPVRELAELVFARWEKAPTRKPLLDLAIDLQRLAINLDPHHFRGYWTLGRWYALRHEIVRKPEDVALSLEFYARAVELHPHNVLLLADYARVLEQAGEIGKAADIAKRTLELDDLNRREGHSDKYLPAEIRQRLSDALRKRQGPSRPSQPGDRN
jgi:O-antigen ligase